MSLNLTEEAKLRRMLVLNSAMISGKNLIAGLTPFAKIPHKVELGKK